MALLYAVLCLASAVHAFTPAQLHRPALKRIIHSTAAYAAAINDEEDSDQTTKQKIVIVGAGWGGLSAAHSLATSDQSSTLDITLVDASPRVGGLVRDGFQTINNSVSTGAEAGQHGFWDNYLNIFKFLENLPTIKDVDEVLTGYAEQGQYSPNGLEAVWPVYRESTPQLPTGLAQALYKLHQFATTG